MLYFTVLFVIIYTIENIYILLYELTSSGGHSKPKSQIYQNKYFMNIIFPRNHQH